MGKHRTKKCSLCKVKNKYWENGLFFEINCKHHFIPMLVLKQHKGNLTEEEKMVLMEIIDTRHPGKFPNGSMSHSNEHWHTHITKKKTL